MFKVISKTFNKRAVLFSNGKYFKPYCRFMSEKSVQTEHKVVPPKDNSSETIMPKMTHTPNNFEQRLLVWIGKYKKIEDIPQKISFESMTQARNKARIKLANYMMVGTVIGCIVMIISGKRAAARGETLEKMNIDWHKSQREEAQK